MLIRILKPVTAAIAAVSLAGCLSGNSSDGGTGFLSLDITDAPVDSLEEVVITITGITLKPAGAGRVHIELEENQTLDLLKLTRGNSANLISDHEVPAGNYNWIQLHLSDNQAYPDMYVVEQADGGHQNLTVPSGQQQGLRLVSGFTVPQDGSANFTIDFDVRKSVVKPTAQPYKLRPALRLVDNVEVGSVAGEVFQEVWASCADVNEFAGLVYVYEGADVTPVDFNINREDGEPQPLLAANVEMQEDGLYTYKAAFLTEGDYTIAYTCTPDAMEEDDNLDFQGTRTVTIVANTTQQEDFEGSSE